jgi:hypothetical protein
MGRPTIPASAANAVREVADTDIDYDIEVVEQLRSVMIANMVVPPPPAEPPTNPWPAD